MKYRALTLVKSKGAKEGDLPVYHQPGDIFEADPKDMERVIAAGGAEPAKNEPHGQPKPGPEKSTSSEKPKP